MLYLCKSLCSHFAYIRICMMYALYYVFFTLLTHFHHPRQGTHRRRTIKWRYKSCMAFKTVGCARGLFCCYMLNVWQIFRPDAFIRRGASATSTHAITLVRELFWYLMFSAAAACIPASNATHRCVFVYITSMCLASSYIYFMTCDAMMMMR